MGEGEEDTLLSRATSAFWAELDSAVDWDIVGNYGEDIAVGLNAMLRVLGDAGLK